MLRALILLLALGLAPALPRPGLAQDFPSYTDLYVNDFAQVLTAAERTALRSVLAGLWRDPGAEITLATIDSLAARAPGLGVEAYAQGLFNAWTVGRAGQNEGILILLAPEEREVRIVLGAG